MDTVEMVRVLKLHWKQYGGHVSVFRSPEDAFDELREAWADGSKDTAELTFDSMRIEELQSLPEFEGY